MGIPSPARIYGTYALLTLIWGTTWAVIRIGLRGLPPFTGVALRFGIAALLLLVLSPLLRVHYLKTRAERWLWAANALLGFSIPYAVTYWSEQWIPSGLAAVLFATFPLFVAVLAHLFLPAERLNGGRFMGILLGFAGVAVIFSEDFSVLGGPEAVIASVVMLASPLSAAAANVFIKKWGEGIHPVSLTVIPMGLTAGMIGFLALATERDAPMIFDASSVAALLYLAVFGSAVTFTLYYWLLQHMPATRHSLVAYTIPVVAVAVGSIFLDEPITLRMISGSILVIAGVALAGYRRKTAVESGPAAGRERLDPGRELRGSQEGS